MPKREDESYLIQKEGDINVCEHGHYKLVCDICANKPKPSLIIFPTKKRCKWFWQKGKH